MQVIVNTIHFYFYDNIKDYKIGLFAVSSRNSCPDVINAVSSVVKTISVLGKR
jgi:hypothetical protein